MITVTEEIPPQVPSLPHWPERPEQVDTDGTSFLVLAVGSADEVATVAGGWVAQAEAVGPTTLGILDSVDAPEDLRTVEELLGRARTGVRVMVVGGQYEVLRLLSLLRRRGALESELTAFATDTTAIPLFCAHCQTIFRAEAAPGGEDDCPGCARRLEIHEHMAVLLGAFLGSVVYPDVEPVKGGA